MIDKPQIWLRAQAAAPKEMVRQALTDTSAYRAWWASRSCSIDRVDGTFDVGKWVGITSIGRNGRTRTYGGQVLEVNGDDLTFSWRGRSADAVRVTIRLEALDKKKSTQIDALISGVSSAETASSVQREWSLILRILGGAWGAPQVRPRKR